MPRHGSVDGTVATGSDQITFLCCGPHVQAGTVEALLAAGLVETDRLKSEDGRIVDITLQDDKSRCAPTSTRSASRPRCRGPG